MKFYKYDRSRVPILINTRDIHKDLIRCLQFFDCHNDYLENLSLETHPIFVYDNASTFDPLCSWYGEIGGFEFNKLTWVIEPCLPRFQLYRSTSNDGPRGCMRLLENIEHDYFFTVEPDLDFTYCESKIIDYLHSGLVEHPEFQSAGVSLRINDLISRFALYATAAGFDPANEEQRKALLEHIEYLCGVLMHEGQFWQKRVDPRFFEAGIDTAGVLHRKGWDGSYDGIRLAYSAVDHIPWMHYDYNRPEDYAWYLDHADHCGTFYTQRTIAKRREKLPKNGE